MKKDINHTPKKNPQETSIDKCPLSEARFKAYNVPKKIQNDISHRAC